MIKLANVLYGIGFFTTTIGATGMDAPNPTGAIIIILSGCVLIGTGSLVDTIARKKR